MPTPTPETNLDPLLADLSWVEGRLERGDRVVLPPVTWRDLDIGPIPRRQRLRRWAADRLEGLGARFIELADRVRYAR